MSETVPQLPDLELIEQVGSGGMSTVWKAFDRKISTVVAVKILKRELTGDPEELHRFIDEEKMMETIHHVGIVRSYGIRFLSGIWYYVMEFVDGYNFQTLLARKKHLAEEDCLLICESVAAALDYVWTHHHIVHCDIKPENIMINTDGEVKLTDLGISHTFKFLKDGRQDVPDHVLGTPAYISPEQVYGDVELDQRSDIYSLGATLYHLATGCVLFPGFGDEAMMRAHCGDSLQAADPRTYRPQLSRGFCQLLEAMLVKNRDERLADWRAVLNLCLDIERGVALKPRATSGVSTLKLND